ncbi:MAG: bifunctional 4-alpha-glucanotransferase/malto-oligosyltrehalose synthase [Betaproteobacteria bacterium]|nr:bifunctional 4-alpha-glucanotransferase/malto-oligosyltrehalose synthase [Betaproteobacteria bacterium]
MSVPVPPLSSARIPRATYRLQLNRDFDFRAAAAAVPYLAELGVSDVYCSPYLRARPGSMHGYDIIDHGSFNPEIGTPEDFAVFCAALKAHGMGQIADVVPNHMGVLGGDNAWWLDVLENGQASAYAEFFDIDWQPASPDLQNRVLLPALGDHYGLVLERGEITLSFDAALGAFRVDYYDHRFPVDPRTYVSILDQAADDRALSELPPAAVAELGGLGLLFLNLPRRDERDAMQAARRNSEKEALKQRLALLVAQHRPLADAIARAVKTFNGGDGRFDVLHELLEAQGYRLSYWRVAADEINYRRFFDVNHLAALRMENHSAFEATHRFIFELIERGDVQGLRIDHPDGLRDPAAYFHALQERYARLPGKVSADAPASTRPLYVVIEKIIAPFERLPDTWAVHGDTGYRYANLLNGVFIDADSESKMTRAYQAFAGEVPEFAEVAYRSRRLVLRDLLASELTVLANQLRRIARADRRTRDYTFTSLRQALAEVIACFPVYRTYIAEAVSEVDRRYIEWAVAGARRRSNAADGTVFDFVRSMLLCEGPAGCTPELAAAIRVFASKVQQVTSPVMAKGIEDTSFYVYNRLASLNDVGADPVVYGVPVKSFHNANVERARDWPHAMLASSTHDNKRSEDVRARIDVLSEMPALWRLQLRRWSRTNRSKKRELDGLVAPTRNDEYLLYQVLLGSFPDGEISRTELETYCTRIEQYMIKALREAKAETSWISPNQAYEDAMVDFVRALLSSRKRNLFLDKFRTVLSPLARLGLYNSLSMVALKLSSPGMPDIYQGNEVWDFSLVDPDNRRQVDYEARRAALARLRAMAPAGHLDAGQLHQLLETPADGLAKLYVTWRLLTLRREYEALFRDGRYTALALEGARVDHVVAYARRHEGRGVVVIVPRLYAALTGNGTKTPCGAAPWNNTRVLLPFLAPGTVLRHAFTGAPLELQEGALPMALACADFPLAVLVYDEGDLGTE